MDISVGYPRPGETVGPFRLERQLGVGGMGVVFVATDPVLERQVALKVIAPHLAQDPSFRERFTREAQAQASLDSPHVVHVYAHGEADGRLYIATQLVPGGDLGAMIQTYGAPPVRVAVDLIAQVAGGLAAAHSRGLIHRDIKPANVLVAQREQGFSAYLADFGIARRLDAQQLTTAGGTLGTPTYMAPELHTGGEPGVASDIYSVGCLLWSALSGQAPYGGTSDYQIVSAHLAQPVPQLPGTGPFAAEVNRVLRTAMAKDPRDRHTSAGALRDDLVGVLRQAGAGATGLPPGPPPPTAPPAVGTGSAPAAGRGRRLALVAGAVVLVVAGGLGAFAATRGGDEEPSPGAGSESPSTRAGDEARAVAGLTAGFAPTLGEESATCIAEEVVRATGVEKLVEAGFFDEDYTFLDPDLTHKDDIKMALNTATFACVGELAPTG